MSYWLVQNNVIRPEESWNAEVVYAINQALEAARRPASASRDVVVACPLRQTQLRITLSQGIKELS